MASSCARIGRLAVAVPLTKHRLYGYHVNRWLYIPGTDNNSNKIGIVYVDFCVVDNVVYTDTVNHSNKTWPVQMCVVYSNNNKIIIRIFRNAGGPEALR